MNKTSTSGVCIWCSGALSQVVSLGRIPLVNTVIPTRKKGQTFPLTLKKCNACDLVQVGYIVPPRVIFKRYSYMSGASVPLVQSLERSARLLIKIPVKTGASILDIGSNDGTFLVQCQKYGLRGVGIEPVSSLVERSRVRGITTVEGFFTKKNAEALVDRFGRFDVVTATHVLANIPNIRDALAGVHAVLAPEGTFIVEVASLYHMIHNSSFDSVYHEHYSYFSVHTLRRILTDAGFTVTHVTRSRLQGGSIRVFCRHQDRGTPSTQQFSPISPADYTKFASRVLAYPDSLKRILQSFRTGSIVGFGAPAKSVTLLAYCGITFKILPFTVDSTIGKQYSTIPGTRIPIYPESYLSDPTIDAVLLLSWNYQSYAVRRITKLMGRRVPIIHPFPVPHVIS